MWDCGCVQVGRIDGRYGDWNNITQVAVGGTWSPEHCVARQRVAIVIPFRDRAEHLATLLPVLHAMMSRQQLHYTVYVVEQVCHTVTQYVSLSHGVTLYVHLVVILPMDW